tara:strand:- start:184 stop:318 length:135 start_codon:yes stop_codon:yes gene_type:complete
MFGKKGYMHYLGGGAILGFIIGLIVMYLVAKGVIPLGLDICGSP